MAAAGPFSDRGALGTGGRSGVGPAGAGAPVTGGGRGVGLAVAGHLLAGGARVVITGRDRARGRAAQDQLGDGARFVAADVTDDADVRRSVDEALAFLGRLDVLVTSAGVALVERLTDTPPAHFDRLMAVNVRGRFLYGQACMDALAATRGSMVHIASDAGLRGEQAIG